ncbi:toxin-antitoxin system YwqK family antitoxin [Aestuariibaculum sp. YM273]|uniref:toxin-antitoxin system YwqK family antitoxin n=1 Tax=Aestuariibaculum sp. YM273 TaxID=3070659 RepID=UPI0027DC7B11|nr:toxin-antitoxin system YwqK family antitoxin [Aestuariibaculum sp. YM273]WMI66721.1 toxin-antitoxin system YwqK family antitoxin [Aestuariibaculum sp. YM273]
MKLLYLTLISLLIISCNHDINNKNFRNENYVFYQEDGKKGEWREIDPDLKIKPPKSFSTYFYPNGNRYLEQEVLDSFPNRILKHYDMRNVLSYTATYRNDSLIDQTFENGYHYEYHSNLGNLKCEGIIKNSMFQGKWKFYWKDGKTLRQIVEYKNDTLHGIREDYWENGNLKSKTTNVKGNQNGKTFHYYENGQLEEVLYIKNNLAHGKSIRYYENGNIQAKCQYWNRITKDTCRFYYEDGSLSGIEVSKIDTLTSSYAKTVKSYYKNGNLKQSFKSINGKNNGLILTYFENGNLYLKINAVDNIKNGEAFEYHENGNLKFKAFYKNDLIDGEMLEYNNNGKLIKTHIVEKGVKVDSIIH